MLGKEEIKRIDPKEYVCVIIWSVDDVMEQARQLNIKCSKAEAEGILEEMENRHDTTIGINWDTINSCLADLNEERSEAKAKKKAKVKVSFS
jgi:hypothetical protein